MPESALTPGVLVVAAIALSISVLSLYISHRYLPAKIRTAYLKSITALATAVETKDAGTIGHAQRVAELTVETARRLGVTGRDLERIQYAALLMDIGKANVPQGILNKKDKLTDEEWEIVKSHTKRGAEMVAAVPFLADTADYILHHHEYYDGSGYPDGLKGEGIPRASRILTVAADYDAMVSERPYHTHPLSHEEAVGEIRKAIGGKYDPEAARVFLEMLAEEERI